MSTKRQFEFECPNVVDTDVPVTFETFGTDYVDFTDHGETVAITARADCPFCGHTGHSKKIEPEELFNPDGDYFTISELGTALECVLDCDPDEIEIEEDLECYTVNIVIPELVWINANTLHAAIEPYLSNGTVLEIYYNYEDIDYSDQDEQSVPEPPEILRANADLAEEKDDDYGKSWKLAGKTLAMWAEFLDIEEIDAQSEGEVTSNGLYYQRLIKLIRAFNLEYGSGDPHNEPIPESHGDGSNYGAIHEHHARAQQAESDD